MLARGQRGFALIEVMVSAMLVGIISVGMLAGIDAAGSTSGTNKARGIAASLAQDDQERMRAATASALAVKRDESRTVTVGGVAFSVKSTMRPVASSGTGCGDGTLLKIDSEVSWPQMRGLRPVRLDSLVASKPGSYAQGQGGLVVAIHDRNGEGLAGVPVSISGPKSDTDTTDSNGCASFLYIPKGDYTVSFSRSGYVTPDGRATVSQSIGVPDGSGTSVSHQYDAAGTIDAAVRTLVNGVPQADESESLAISHPNLPAPGLRTFTSGSPRASFSTGATLFPFTSPYSVFSGRCTGAAPPAGEVVSASVEPGGSATVEVVEPALNLTVEVERTSGGFEPMAGATVRVADKTCGGSLTFPQTTNAQGRLPKPGLPYGDYDVCAHGSVNGTRRRVTTAAVSNRQKAGTAPFTIRLRSSSTSGSCP